MAKMIVSDYEICTEIPPVTGDITGTSVALKNIVSHVFADNSVPRTVLDIGFGRGHLGKMIKQDPITAHWTVDGVDGFLRTCSNVELFKQKYYRNIWHGLAQELDADLLKKYDLLCFFDVIEHLEVESAKRCLTQLLSALGEHGRLIVSTPMWYMPQDPNVPGDLEEHLFGVPAQSMLLLQPLMYHIDPAFMVGTFVFSRASLDHIHHFQPTTDKGFDFAAGMNHLQRLGRNADGRLYKVAHA